MVNKDEYIIQHRTVLIISLLHDMNLRTGRRRRRRRRRWCCCEKLT